MFVRRARPPSQKVKKVQFDRYAYLMRCCREVLDYFAPPVIKNYVMAFFRKQVVKRGESVF